MTEIGSIIQPGQSIPDDVTDMVDAQNSTGRDWPRWVRHYLNGTWDFWSLPERAERWRNDPHRSGRPSADLVAEAKDMGWAPLTVTAVREQPAESEPDVLDLVRQWGDARCLMGIGRDYAANTEAAGALFARIEAEVQRLRAEDARAAVREKVVEAARVILDEAGIPRDGTTLNNRVRALVEQRDQALADVERWRERVLDLLPDPADPLVLSLPQVPEGAVALVGVSGVRYERQVRDGRLQWRHPAGAVVPLGEVLDNEEPVTVVMREPRTWDELPGTPEGVRRVHDAHGQTWRHLEQGYWSVAEPQNDADRRDLRCFSELRELFGPLVEVFDDEDGTR